MKRILSVLILSVAALSSSAFAGAVKFKFMICDLAKPLDGMTHLDIYADIADLEGGASLAFSGKTESGKEAGFMIDATVNEKTHTATAILNEAYGYKYVVTFKPIAGTPNSSATVTSTVNGKNETVTGTCQMADIGFNH